MKTATIKYLAEGLVSACQRLEKANTLLVNTKVAPYYEIIGSESERQADIKQYEKLIQTCEALLKQQIRIINLVGEEVNYEA